MCTMVRVSAVLLVLFIQTVTASPAETLHEPEQSVTNEDRPNPNPSGPIAPRRVRRWFDNWFSGDGWSWSFSWDDPGGEASSKNDLECGLSEIQVGLQLSSLVTHGMDGFSGHLDDRSCTDFTKRDGIVWYQVARRADTCGNTLTTNSTHAIYSNTLFVYPANNTSSSLPMSFPFSCVYPLDTETSLEVPAAVAIGPVGRSRVQSALSGHGPHARASMSLFHDSNYTEPYPAGPVTLPLGSALHVGVSVEQTETERFAVVLDNCYSTPSSNHNDSRRHFFVQNRCASNRGQVTVDENGSSLQARFSAQLQVSKRGVFLHCRLHLCDQTTSTCSPVCSGRKARSVSSAMNQPLTIGPITWKNVAG